MTVWWEHRRLVLSLVLCFVVALGVVVALRTYGPRPWSELTLQLSAPASPTPTLSPALHATYVASLQTMPPAPLRVGEQITFQWTPYSSGRVSAASGPAPVNCTLSLYGPYASEADLNKRLNGTSDWTALLGRAAFTAPPLTMSDWDTSTQQTDVLLPKTLHAGYYLVVGECQSERDHGSVGTDFPIQIGA